MQRYAGAADFLNQRFAARLKFFEIRRPDQLVCCSGKNYVGHFKIAHRAVVRVGKCIDLFGNAQRCLSGFIIWAHITDHGRINRISKDD